MRTVIEMDKVGMTSMADALAGKTGVVVVTSLAATLILRVAKSSWKLRPSEVDV